MRYSLSLLHTVFIACCLLEVFTVPVPNGAKRLDDSNSVSCVSVTFLNAYRKPIRIWKTMSRTSFKGFIVLGKTYRLKTMVRDPHKPVVYHAEPLNANDTRQLLLDGQESISVLPFDCDDKFINVTISSVHQPQEQSDNVLISRSHTASSSETSNNSKACLLSQGGNAGGQCCYFPFVYKGVSHTTCINSDREALWCATTKDFDNRGLWGFCK